MLAVGLDEQMRKGMFSNYSVASSSTMCRKDGRGEVCAANFSLCRYRLYSSAKRGVGMPC
jgi:ribosomal protein S14